LPLLALAFAHAAFDPHTVARCTIEGDRWTVRHMEAFSEFREEGGAFLGRDKDRDYLEVRRNGRLVLERRFEYSTFNAKFIKWPFNGALLAVVFHSGCGHGQWSWFYVVHNHRLHGPMMRVECEVGGPIFKDLDGDGRPEMIFDNWDYYKFEWKHNGPDKYRVYKVTKKYRIRFWKTIPNHRHVRLPDRLG
jgi:hypothetical protein